MELKLAPITRARMKKLKASNGNEDIGMIAYMEEALKNKFGEFGDQGKVSKLFSICLISKDHSRKQLEGENWPSVQKGHSTADGIPASTTACRLLPRESLEFTHLLVTVGGPMGSNYQSKEELYLSISELNGWIKREEDDCQEDIIDKEESNEDQEIDSFDVIEEE
ncbi:hypothetical protein M9H77_23244 [Catharanthus roseus]|uniref:Uncharacterized protein n=1 Tax=Catharanthus roseus TaxID=4058 RepID=A0ACC0ATG7_CATRO|nr:hypothetical protein M9H77_23244 [Catharanthus roseus]